MPRNFVHARNANGRVAMGLHGYRIGVGEYGRIPLDRRGIHPFIDPFHGRFLGWTPRQQDGFHMRRVGGAMFMQGAPIVPERPDGRMKPGELQNGGYGFYYKGEQQKAQMPENVYLDLIDDDEVYVGNDEKIAQSFFMIICNVGFVAFIILSYSREIVKKYEQIMTKIIN